MPYGWLERARLRTAPPARSVRRDLRRDLRRFVRRDLRIGMAAITLAMLAAAPASMAARVEGLYDVEVVVASRSAKDRRTATGAALGEVLVRVTGLRHVPRIPAVREALNEPERFYVQYAYSSRAAPHPPILHDGNAADGVPAANATGRDGSAARDQTPPMQTLLKVRFDPASVLELVRRAGLPLWGADRPRILAWIVVDHAGRTEMIPSMGSRFATAITRGARERGMPMTLPLMDIDDNLISPSDVRGRFWRLVQRASVRYRPDMVLVAWISATDDRWQAEWELRSSNDDNSAPEPTRVWGRFTTPAPAPRASKQAPRPQGAEAVLGQLVDVVTDELMQRLAVLNRGEDTVRLRVAGIGSPRDYADLLHFLKSREYMDRVEVRMLAPKTVHLMLHSRSSKHQLERLLTIDGVLVPDATPGGGSGTMRAGTARAGTVREGTVRNNGNGAALFDIALRWSGR